MVSPDLVRMRVGGGELVNGKIRMEIKDKIVLLPCLYNHS
jgi:hypothetical protein